MRPLLLAAFLFLPLVSVAADKPRVVVLDLASDRSTKSSARFVTVAVMTELSRTGRFDVIGSSDIQALLGLERQKQLLGCTNDESSCLAELSGALGAEYLVTGSLGKVGKQTRLDLTLLQTKGSRVLARDGGPVTDDTLPDETSRIVRALLAALPGAPSAAPVETVVARPSGEGSRPLAPKILLGAGAVALAAGGVLLGTAASFKPADYEYTEALLKQQEARTRQTVGFVALGAGAAAAVAGAAWLFLAPRAPQVAVVPTSGGVAFSLKGHF